MSSPMINNVIIIGSILCYTAVILYGLDSRLIEIVQIPVMCNVSVTFFDTNQLSVLLMDFYALVFHTKPQFFINYSIVCFTNDLVFLDKYGKPLERSKRMMLIVCSLLIWPSLILYDYKRTSYVN